jgi:hypothetical protein
MNTLNQLSAMEVSHVIIADLCLQSIVGQYIAAIFFVTVNMGLT